MAVSVLWFFRAVPWVGLQRVIVAFSDHTHFLYSFKCVKLWADNLFMFRHVLYNCKHFLPSANKIRYGLYHCKYVSNYGQTNLLLWID